MQMDLQISLLKVGIKAGRIHGDLTPRERTRMMKQIRDLEFPIYRSDRSCSTRN